MEERRCIRCQVVKTGDAFRVRVRKGRLISATMCRTCDNKRLADRRKRLGKTKEPRQKRYDEKRSLMRRSNENTGRWIMIDSRKSDKKAGRQNDLTRDFVDAMISQGCVYCGESSLRMTLDRKDNSLGHLQNNVVPACIRCNYLRRDMPYDAWLHIAQSVRRVRESGLFGNWIGGRW